MTQANIDCTGGAAGKAWFTTTHWSVVMAAREEQDSGSGTEAMETLCRTYWYPLYAFVRREGYEEEAARDLVQDFFGSLIERKFLMDVSAGKGRFRSYLLACLRHFMGADRVRQRAVKRGGRHTLISLETLGAEGLYALEEDREPGPERFYDQRWALALMEQALKRLSLEWERAGKQAQWERLKSFVSDEPEAGEYERVGADLGWTVNAVRVAVHRLRCRYRELVRAEVACTVEQPMDIDAEMRYLLGVLGGGLRAGLRGPLWS